MGAAAIATNCASRAAQSVNASVITEEAVAVLA
jgi:hypothetical protein